MTLVEYGDFECPHCGAPTRSSRPFSNELGDQLRSFTGTFRSPRSIPTRQLAAEAAEAAGAQGKFWEMHDMLFEHQHALDDLHLAEYATEIGLELVTFLDALARHAHAARVREEFLSGVRSGVNGTPALFVNDIRYDGPRDFDSLMAVMGVATRATR